MYEEKCAEWTTDKYSDDDMRIFNIILLILSGKLFIDKYNCTNISESNKNDTQVNEAAQPSAT